MLSMAGSSGMPPSSQFLPVRSIRCLKKLPHFSPWLIVLFFWMNWLNYIHLISIFEPSSIPAGLRNTTWWIWHLQGHFQISRTPSHIDWNVVVKMDHLFDSKMTLKKKKQTPHMGVSENRGTPKSSHFNRVFHYKASILGYPYFWKHPHHFKKHFIQSSIVSISSPSFSPQKYLRLKHFPTQLGLEVGTYPPLTAARCPVERFPPTRFQLPNWRFAVSVDEERPPTNTARVGGIGRLETYQKPSYSWWLNHPLEKYESKIGFIFPNFSGWT